MYIGPQGTRILRLPPAYSHTCEHIDKQEFSKWIAAYYNETDPELEEREGQAAYRTHGFWRFGLQKFS
jgi:hypothetical protein